ncbi:MAG: beta-ketoacyl-[acyl-carrier-protein] synthase [Fluviicola sp.]|jgi:3-oxoacyl-[acyl-carrier-protein] synthase II|uniref:beta-ketoacyl-ACP synthase II n=1 Tax=Fluviicola sp. TaxID=1917219 RepID=UPI00260AD39D|nr:beta-ketoacyl-ACP synthase II [Fluviicola sp.]MDF3027016.1 beta-ketoacyl-[acyl-carrier-protein] synthase [Fluviicola sp.]
MKRVVITGMGTVNPLGKTVSEFWENSLKGKSGARNITRFDAAHFKTQFACEIDSFDPARYLSHAEIKRSDLFTQYALYAAAQALEDSGLDLERISPFDIGVIWGSGQGGMGTFEEEVKQYTQSNFIPKFNPFFVPKLIANMASGMISIKFGLQGINYTTVSACATSNTALMDAFNYIRLGKAKVFVSGGSEAPITEASVAGFNAMKAMSTNNASPAEASRPFDTQRDGFVMGEGAGALILEEYEHAKQRGAKIYGEMVGASMTADAYHMTATHPDGIGAIKAMELAMEEAGLNPRQIDYLNAHATSTSVGDLSEITAIRSVFGDESPLSISATKSMTGHLLGAAGAVEAILSVKSMNENIIPPTINLHNPDPAIPGKLHLVKNTAFEKQVKVAMSNTFGFGGHNSIVIFKEI